MLVVVIVILLILIVAGAIFVLMKNKKKDSPVIPASETNLKVFTTNVNDPRAIIYHYVKINSLNDVDKKLIKDLFSENLDFNTNNYALFLDFKSNDNVNLDNIKSSENFEDLKNNGMDLDCMIKVSKGEAYTYQCKNFYIQGLVVNPKGNTDISKVLGKSYRENKRPIFDMPYNDYTKPLYDNFFAGINN